MEGDEFIMSVGFKNITKCQIRGDISASDTTILLENTADYVPFISSPGDYVYAVLRDQQYKEIVKIDVAASSTYGLSVGRGQENTSARSWNRGSLFYQDLTADSLDILRQKEVFRTVTYNPNGIIAPAYAYEKIYQTGATACEKRWWKAITATHLVWMLIAGELCDGEMLLYPDDPGWDWDVPPAWEWPVIVYQVATPLIIPPGGTYTQSQSVEISCATSGATIYYTDDGSEPDDNSTEYAGAITVSDTFTTLKAIAYRADTVTSDINTEDYVLPPTFDIISRGYRTTFGQMANGELWGWGINTYGHLAQGDVTATKWTPIQVSGLTTWADLAGGQYSIYGIKDDGTLWVCGLNNHGQLGLGDTTDRHILTQVGTGTSWSKVFSSYWNVYAIKNDGSLWVWGWNAYSALGLGDTTERHSPVQLGVLTNYATASVTNDNILVIKTDGTLWGWGRNYGGELGLGDRNQRSTPTQISALTTWSKISIGAYKHSLALKTDGTMWAWGDNYYGTCGQGNSGAGTRYNYLTPTQIGALTTFKAISVNGSGACMATKTDGTLGSWGYGASGQLGHGNTTDYSVPTQIDTATDWDRPISGEWLSSHVLKTDKTLYAAGYYLDASLGLGVIGANVDVLTKITTIEI